jgi:hypothetical protein
LRYQRNRIAQRIDLHVGDVLPVDHDLAAIGIEESKRKIDQSALAGA